jgi:hypothetical protein
MFHVSIASPDSSKSVRELTRYCLPYVSTKALILSLLFVAFERRRAIHTHELDLTQSDT